MSAKIPKSAAKAQPATDAKKAASAAADVAKAETKPKGVIIQCSRCKGSIMVTVEYDAATRDLAFRLCNSCSWDLMSSPPD
jgi:hypothetical protein